MRTKAGSERGVFTQLPLVENKRIDGTSQHIVDKGNTSRKVDESTAKESS